MTFEEAFSNLGDKIGADFNWCTISFTDKTFTAEIYREIQKGHQLYGKVLYSTAKCTSNDDVLFVTGDEHGHDLYVIIHLTYCKNDNNNNYPRFVVLGDIYEAMKHLEKQYYNEYTV